MPTISVPNQGIALQHDNDKDFLISMLVQQIECLYLCKRIRAKTAVSVRSSTASLTHEATAYSSVPQFTRVLRHRYKNQLRMLTHRWKKLGLGHPASATGTDQTSGQSQEKSTSTKSQMQSRRTAAHGERCEKFGVVLSECYSDSDLSDQERGSVESPNITTNVDLDLKPERFERFLHSPDIPEFYPDVLPAPLEALDFTQLLSSQLASEFQQSLDRIDPCLGPIIRRLLELERLQSATVQKERERPTRLRPNPVHTPIFNRVKKCDILSSKVKIPGCTRKECGDTVTCAFAKLALCPNSSRHHGWSAKKNDQGSRTARPRSVQPKRPQTTTGKLKRGTSVNVSEKFTMPKAKPRRVDVTSGKPANVTRSRKTY